MNQLQEALRGVAATQELKEWTRRRLVRERTRRRSAGRKGLAAAVCACLLCLLLGAGGYRFYMSSVSYISIDVNPSLELGLNAFDRVVQTVAYNDGGDEIAARLSLQNMPYQQAVDEVLSDQVFQSYAAQGNGVVFTVVSGDGARLQAGLEGCSGYYASGGHSYLADARCLDEAHTNGLSVGKYRAYLELSEYDPSVTVDDCHHMSMGELQQRLEQCHEGAQSTQGHGHGEHRHGHS